ncbi:MAG: hypothetical protein KF752_11665 [Pirellulaceae bacterium]|nr:hypothetical protein [Pirellulaceae bacterium]
MIEIYFESEHSGVHYAYPVPEIHANGFDNWETKRVLANAGGAGMYRVLLDPRITHLWLVFAGEDAPESATAPNKAARIDTVLRSIVEGVQVPIEGSYQVTGDGGDPDPTIANIGEPAGTMYEHPYWEYLGAGGRLWTLYYHGGRWKLEDQETDVENPVEYWGELTDSESPAGEYEAHENATGTVSVANTTSTQYRLSELAMQAVRITLLEELIQQDDNGDWQFKERALQQVRRWAAGTILPNEPNPPQRRIGAKSQTLFIRENIPMSIPLVGNMEAPELEAIEGLTLQFVVETTDQQLVHEEEVNVDGGTITLASSMPLTELPRVLVWSLRKLESDAYIAGGRISVVYAPVKQVEPEPEPEP